jgi:hypothetical protein
MGLLDRFAHGVVSVIATFVSAVLSALEWCETSARATMSNAGLHGDMQTLVLMFVVASILLAASRLLRGPIRTGLVVVLMLTLAHVCSSVAHGPLTG